MLNVEFIGGDAIAAVLKAYSDGVQSAVEKSIAIFAAQYISK